MVRCALLWTLRDADADGSAVGGRTRGLYRDGRAHARMQVMRVRRGEE